MCNKLLTYFLQHTNDDEILDEAGTYRSVVTVNYENIVNTNYPQLNMV